MTRIRSEEIILKLLQDESILLKKFMFKNYSISLNIDPEKKCILNFPFEQRWLRGEEYGFLCRHYYAYSYIHKMFKSVNGNHPEEIYHSPRCKFSLFIYILILFIFRRTILFHREDASLIFWLPKEDLGLRLVTKLGSSDEQAQEV